MPDSLHGFPFWIVEFNDGGAPRDAAAANRFVDEVKAADLTDLHIFSHGWNNSPGEAKRLYDGFFGEMAKILGDPARKARDAKIGFAGVIWPSILFPDKELADTGGGAASFGGADASAPPALATELKKVFTTPEQQTIVDELTAMLDAREQSMDELRKFKTKLRELASAAADQNDVDALEATAVTVPDDDFELLFDALADGEASDDAEEGGAVAFNPFKRLWDGAKGALRVTTYWTMKSRAGTVGRKGLGPLIAKLHAAVPELRVHLMGHSFGARVVSYSLAGLPATATGPASPVKSLFLLQGAFSHFAFAEALPFDRSRRGDLAGMAARVDGPLVTTHSLKDSAVGTAYPLASIAAGQDAADASDRLYRWGAMGHDGAQEVNAVAASLGMPGTTYTFAAGKWINLDGNSVIVKGGPPSGAHSDIIHPHTAWAELSAAGLVK